MHRFKGPQHRLGGVITFACANGNVFAATNNGKEWGIFSLNRERGEWTFTSTKRKWGHLLGGDGTRLVAITDIDKISWLEPAAN